jgi:serine phosphatase RsbU (regulator of sigma subunit)
MAPQDEFDPTEQTIVTTRPVAMTPPLQIGHYLTFTQDGALRRVRIGLSGLTVGRVPPCDIVLPDPLISRRHCQIALDGDWALVTDLGSTNGTFLAGQRIEQPTRLRNGSQIVLGSQELRYERRDEREVAEEAELATELRRAVDYVRAILPEPISAGSVQADWWFVPSLLLGGDAFGYQFLDETTLAGFLLDVSGHGIGAALHAVNVANALRRHALPGTDPRDPAQVAAALNAMFPMESHGGLMLTFWYFVYDTTSRRLRYCSAGHHAALLVTSGAAAPELLRQRGPAIGMLPFGRWAVGETNVAPGSRLYVFSDGAFEIVSAAGEQWGIDHLQAIVMRPEQPGLSEPQRMYQAVRAAARPGPLPDDFSALVLRFT